MNTMMHDSLIEFHKAFDCAIATAPALPDRKTRALRSTLVLEELRETLTAAEKDDFVEFVDGLIDVLYVAVGTNVSYGIKSVEPVFPTPYLAPQAPKNEFRSLVIGVIRNHIRGAMDYLDPAAVSERGDTVMVGVSMNLLITDCLMILHFCHVDAVQVFKEVHRSNMAKLGPDGKPLRREDGKVIKPEGWTKPDIAGELERQAHVTRFRQV